MKSLPFNLYESKANMFSSKTETSEPAPLSSPGRIQVETEDAVQLTVPVSS